MRLECVSRIAGPVFRDDIIVQVARDFIIVLSTVIIVVVHVDGTRGVALHGDAGKRLNHFSGTLGQSECQFSILKKEELAATVGRARISIAPLVVGVICGLIM